MNKHLILQSTRERIKYVLANLSPRESEIHVGGRNVTFLPVEEVTQSMHHAIEKSQAAWHVLLHGAYTYAHERDLRDPQGFSYAASITFCCTMLSSARDASMMNEAATCESFLRNVRSIMYEMESQLEAQKLECNGNFNYTHLSRLLYVAITLTNNAKDYAAR